MPRTAIPPARVTGLRRWALVGLCLTALAAAAPLIPALHNQPRSLDLIGPHQPVTFRRLIIIHLQRDHPCTWRFVLHHAMTGGCQRLLQLLRGVANRWRGSRILHGDLFGKRRTSEQDPGGANDE